MLFILCDLIVYKSKGFSGCEQRDIDLPMLINVEVIKNWTYSVAIEVSNWRCQ